MKRKKWCLWITSLAFLTFGATSSAQEGASCDSAINVTPEKCSRAWLKESSTANAAHYGNFWPPECGPPGPPPEYIITTDNICGCIDGPLDYYSEVTKFGCSAGPNPVAKIFETYPWCYVQNGIACPAAVSAGPGLPGIRQCGGTIQQTGQANAFGDKCSGDRCGYPAFAEFLKTWAKPGVYSAFEATGILKTIMEAGPIEDCDGGSCKNFTLVLPVTAAKDNPDALPRGTDLNQLVKNATGHGVAYIGEMFDGRNWKTLGGTTTRASVPSCPNVGAVSVYQAGHLPEGSGGATDVPPTPCLSVAPCISQTIYGEGILFDGARVQYWFITNEAILYFTDSPRHGG